MPTNQDLDNRTRSFISLAPISVTSNTTRNGTGVDVGAAVAVVVRAYGGGVTDGLYTLHVEESDDNTNFTDVDSGRLTSTFTAISASNLISQVGVHPGKRYVRAVMVSTGTSTGAHAIGANIVLKDS